MKSNSKFHFIYYAAAAGLAAGLLAACSAAPPAPSVDVNAQVATIVAATQAAQPVFAVTPEPVQPTAPPAAAPQSLTLQLAPELQTLLEMPETRLQLLAINEQTGEMLEQQYPGGTSTSQFSMALTPGAYRVTALYFTQESVEMLGAWAADGEPLRLEVGSTPLPQPWWLSRPPEACRASLLDIAEMAGQGAAYAFTHSCITAQLIVSFDASVTNPPPVVIYAEGVGMFAVNKSFEAPAAASGTLFTVDVPPGAYIVSARSTVANDPSYYGAWASDGPARIEVRHKDRISVNLTKPGDVCLDVYQLGATPDGRFVETALANKSRCEEPTSAAGEAPGLETLGDPDGVFNFDSAAGWYEFEDNSYEFQVDDGHYQMQAKDQEQNDTWGTNPLKLKDFYLEAIFRVGSSCSDNDRYGLLVRAPNPGYGYVFSVSCGGRFRMYYMLDDKYHAVQEWKSSSEIDTGPNAVNTLGAWMKGDTLRLYINGKLVGEYTDSTFDEGLIGLHLGAVQTSDLEVGVDEVRYWDLDD